MPNVTDPKAWIGKSRESVEIIDRRHAELLAITLDKAVCDEGNALPIPWHWAWFNDAKPASELGRDGHPKRGGFLPPIALPRRMWAGGSIRPLSPIEIGRKILKRSTIEDVKETSGRSGALCIVTVRHKLFDGSTCCLSETQNLVYREDPADRTPPSQTAASKAPQPPDGAQISRSFVPDPVLMFRYSALTFNGHRIHYDVDYARDVEGYRGLVFHGPLTATFLYALAEEISGKAICRFDYRATAPLICGETVSLHGKLGPEKVVVWAENPEGGQAMIAEAWTDG